MLLIVSMLVEILPKFYATMTNEFLTVSQSIHGYYHSHRTAFPSQLCWFSWLLQATCQEEHWHQKPSHADGTARRHCILPHWEKTFCSPGASGWRQQMVCRFGARIPEGTRVMWGREWPGAQWQMDKGERRATGLCLRLLGPFQMVTQWQLIAN